MNNAFLFELGLEEIPANMIKDGLGQMRASCEQLLSSSQIKYKTLDVFASPRRLAVIVKGLPCFCPNRDEIVIGPPESAAYNTEKVPTKAAEGFAKKNGVNIDELEILETKRGPYLTYRKVLPGEAVPNTLVKFLPSIIRSISWSKNMYWEESRFRFVRPLRWYLTLWNDRLLPFEFEGVRANRTTRGHRFLGSQAIELNHVDDYLRELKKNFVIADCQSRKEKIVSELCKVVPQNLHVLPDAELTELVIYLNEYPTVICGDFIGRFLNLPDEVLITVMRRHQKYFAVVDEASKLQPYFLTVINTKGDPTGKIKDGHERVLKSRLEDAVFFWESDSEKLLTDKLIELEGVLFQENLGSYRAKVDRLGVLCAALSKDAHLLSAAKLCKADLTTETVREFPELQGIVGGLCARNQGYPEAVWRAIYEHYKPVSFDDESPSTDLGALLSIADKIDTIVGCYAAGIVPTGSSDPFALRQRAQGLVKILFDYRLDYSLDELVQLAGKNFVKIEVGEDFHTKAVNFLEARVRRLLQTQNIPYDLLNATLAVEFRGVYNAYKRALALVEIKDDKNFEALASSYKRIKNILQKQSIEFDQVSEDLLCEPEEVELFKLYCKVKPKVKRYQKKGAYVVALKEIASLRLPIDRFFEKVLVMIDEVHLRNNRLNLLNNISQLFLTIADISEIVNSPSR